MFYVIQAEEIHWWNDPLGLVFILLLFTLLLTLMVMARRLWRNGDPKRSFLRRAFAGVCESLGAILVIGILVLLGEFLAYATVTQLMNWAWGDRLPFMVSTGGILVLTLLIMSGAPCGGIRSSTRFQSRTIPLRVWMKSFARPSAS